MNFKVIDFFIQDLYDMTPVRMVCVTNWSFNDILSSLSVFPMCIIKLIRGVTSAFKYYVFTNVCGFCKEFCLFLRLSKLKETNTHQYAEFFTN